MLLSRFSFKFGSDIELDILRGDKKLSQVGSLYELTRACLRASRARAYFKFLQLKLACFTPRYAICIFVFKIQMEILIFSPRTNPYEFATAMKKCKLDSLIYL